MRKRLAILLGVLAVSTHLSAPARAEGFFGPNPDRAPSVFTYGYRGLFTGALVGLGGGYLAARRDGFHGDDWRPLVLGSGIGALSGAAVGFTLGFVDLADDRPGRGSIALRDTYYGSCFGALAGAITGGLFVIKTHDAEHILFGASLGVLAGAGAGLMIGLIEGSRIVDSPSHRASAHPRYAPLIGATEDVSGRMTPTAGVNGRF